MHRFPALLIFLIATQFLHTLSAQAQMLCAANHCDVMIQRLMTPGESCVPGGFDPSQTVDYSQMVTAARDFDVFPMATRFPIFAYDDRMDGSYGTDDPGYNSLSYPCNQVPFLAPLPPSRGLYVDFLVSTPTGGGTPLNLLYWDAVDNDGNGLDENDVEWGPVPLDEIFRIETVGGAEQTADGSASEIEGVLIRTTNGSGSIHSHQDFELRRSAGGIPTPGAYLVKMDHTMPGFAEGAPAYYIFSTINTPAITEEVAITQVENQMIEPLCSDGVDNDRDGLTDFAGGDPGCSDAADTSEKSTVYECDDGIDNDGDGLIDYRAVDFGAADNYADRDPGCDLTGATGISEVPEPGAALMWTAGLALLTVLGRKRMTA